MCTWAGILFALAVVLSGAGGWSLPREGSVSDVSMRLLDVMSNDNVNVSEECARSVKNFTDVYNNLQPGDSYLDDDLFWWFKSKENNTSVS